MDGHEAVGEGDEAEGEGDEAVGEGDEAVGEGKLEAKRRVEANVSSRLHSSRCISSNDIAHSPIIPTPSVHLSLVARRPTVLSAQGVLTGFLGPLSPTEDPIKVVVRDQSQDILNAYDRDPELMRSLVIQAYNKTDFKEKDQVATEEIARPIKKHIGGVDGGVKGGDIEGRVDWIHLADHFVCRGRHGLGFTTMEGKDDQADEVKEVEKEMEEYGNIVKEHLVWRFGKWFGEKELLSQVGGPMIREVVEHAGKGGERLAGEGGEGAKKFNVYSCHDVSLLGILYGLKADVVERDKMYWPDYGSWISFEVWDDGIKIRLNGEGVKIEGGDENGRVGWEEWEEIGRKNNAGK